MCWRWMCVTQALQCILHNDLIFIFNIKSLIDSKIFFDVNVIFKNYHKYCISLTVGMCLGADPKTKNWTCRRKYLSLKLHGRVFENMYTKTWMNMLETKDNIFLFNHHKWKTKTHYRLEIAMITIQMISCRFWMNFEFICKYLISRL